MKFLPALKPCSILLCILLCILLSTNSSAQDLVINELSSANLSTLADDEGDFEDWIELYHMGSEALNLAGYGLTDDTAQISQWVFPDTSIQPGAYLLVWASGKDRDLHTNFKIKATGETILLSDASGNMIDEIFSSEIQPDMSIGRYPDGTGNWKNMLNPSPGEANLDSTIHFYTELPVFSSPEGFYEDSIRISLSTPSENDTIYYSLDGSVPSRESFVYTDTLTFDRTTSIRAQAFESTQIPGGIATRTYFIDESTTFSTVSLTTDPYNLYDPDSGIFIFWSPYYESNLFQDWERPIHIQFFDEQKNHGFSMDAGVAVHGGLTRNVPGKSLAIMARSQYGYSKINYKMFEDKDLEVFNNIVLRNSGNDYKWTMFRDCFMHATIQGVLDLDLSASRPAAVHLNGSYWGIRNIREKMNEHFLAGNYNIAPDKIDVLEYKHHNSEVQLVHGSALAFNELITYIASNDLSEDSHYQHVASQMDVKNYIHYNIAQIYFDNSDWPGNNIKWWRRSEPVGKWRWLLFDTDFGFSLSPFGNETGVQLEHYKHNTLQIALATNGEEWPNPPHSTFLLRNLMKNQLFKSEFVNTFCDHLNTSFQADRINPILDEYENLFTPEMERHHEINWSKTGDWHGDIDVMTTFANERVPYVFTHMMYQLGLSRTKKITLDSSDPEEGRIGINSLILESYPWEGSYFPNIAVSIRAIPQPGYRFTGWSDGSDSIRRKIFVGDIAELTASFEAFTSDPADIMINEINYLSSTDYDTEDWVELYNHSEGSVDLSGWIFKDSNDDHTFMIPENTLIEPKSTLVLCRNIQDFKLLRSDIPHITGNIDYGLSSKGESLRLYSPSENLVDHVAYGVSSPWPDLSNLEGSTIELKDPGLDNALPSSWITSMAVGGTPGQIYQTAQQTGLFPETSKEWSLSQNYPNPFTHQTTIAYQVQKSTGVNISVYNLSGQLVKKLVEQNHLPGSYSCIWNGQNSSGVEVNSGIYLYRVTTADYQETRKMILMK